ncbi:Hypothetical predicted protein [Paramuricea clavata]|uniref:Terminal uridylyltransferase 4/7 nucleotidyltransferase domain-containing protein n=1 Tax=Paramuricea clavata TaxID=317549 RepID=A0A6S7H6L1_PARCT|nr:Hypothetical predicted protein [Paramuricea clavata]
MNGDTNARTRPSRNQRRRKNNRNNAQKNEGQNSEKTNDEGQKKQTDSKKQGQQFSGKKQEKEKRVKLVQENVLKNLPIPGPLHLAALSKLLHNISTDYGMSKEDLRLRWQVFNGVKSLFEQEIKGCSLRLYGSSKSALGLKTSDVNICVHEENEEKIPRIFIAFLNVLKGCSKLHNRAFLVYSSWDNL